MRINYLIFALIFFISISLVNADITFEKVVDGPHTVGDNINVIYKFTNTFNQDVNVTIQDENIINGSGYELKCLQFSLPANVKDGVLDLAQNNVQIPFVSPANGTFKLASAVATFKDPTLGIVDTVRSNSPAISIAYSDADVERKIEPINLCDEQQQQQQQEQQKQSQDQPSKKEAQKQKEKQEAARQNQHEEMQQQYKDQSDLQKKLEHSQQNTQQNSQATKQAFEKQQERQQQMDQQMSQQLENNKDMQKQMQEMEQEGYKLMNKSVDAQTNTSGDFSYEYQNQNGTKQKIEGQFEDNKLDDVFNTKEFQDSKEFQDLKKSLEKMGMQQQNLPQKQGDKVTTDFKGINNSAQIQGDPDADNLESTINDSQLMKKILDNPSENNMRLRDELKKTFNSTVPKKTFTITQKPDEEPMLNNGPNSTILAKPVPFNSTTGELLEEPMFKHFNFLWLAPVVILALALLFLRKKEQDIEPIEETPFDHVAESKKILGEAESLFVEGKKKEAYAKAGESIRLFHSYDLGLKRELTNTNIINELKKQKKKTEDTKRCLSLCSLVEFAKYKPNKTDFDKIIGYAKRILW